MSFALFYNTDISYLYATLQSITSLRKFFPAEDIKPYVALMNNGDFDISTLRPVADNLGIKFISINESVIESDLIARWGEGRIPPVTLLKFYLFNILPNNLERVLYIDPDTLFVGNPRRLFEYQPPSGYIGAVEDALTFYTHDWSKNGEDSRAYIRSLGLSTADGYFNAGLLLVNRNVWAEISTHALEYLSKDLEKCLYLDQSALNAVASQRKVSLSPVWNFQTRFRLWENTPCFDLKILHFTGAGKPWLGRMEPWREIHERLLLMEDSINNFGIQRPYLNSELTDLHNKDFVGLKHKVRKIFDFRLAARKKMLQRLHDNAFC